MPGGSPQGLRRYVTRAVVVGAVLFTLGLLMLWWSTDQTSKTAETFLAGAGSTLLTVGLLSVIHDALLKQSLISDFYAMVRVGESVSMTGLSDISAFKGAVDWHEVLSDARDVKAMPLDPLDWLHNEWQFVLAAAERKGVRISVYLPALDQTGNLGNVQDAESFRRQVELAPVRLGRDWQARRSTLHSKSKLNLFTYSGYPSTGVMMTDRRTVLVVPSALGPQHDSQSMLLLFKQGKAPDIRNWVQRTLANLPGLASADEYGQQEKRVRPVEEILPPVAYPDIVPDERFHPLSPPDESTLPTRGKFE